MGELLARSGFNYQREKIIYYAKNTRFIIIDFFLPNCRGAIEIDGMVHKRQYLYDQQRDMWLRENGYKTIRFTNEEILKTPHEVEQRLREIME